MQRNHGRNSQSHASTGEENDGQQNVHYDTPNSTVTTVGYFEAVDTQSSDGYLEPLSTHIHGAHSDPVGTSSDEGYLEPVKTHSPRHHNAPVPEMGSEVSGEVESTPEYAEAYEHMPGRKSGPVYHEIDQ